MIAATSAVMRRRGYLGTRYVDVSEAAGVPMSSLQYHFHSIEELRREALCQLIVYRAGVLRERMQRATTPWDRIDAVIEETCSGRRSGEVPTWFLWLEQRQGGKDHPAVLAAREQATAIYVEDVAAAIRDGIRAGDFSIDAPIHEVLREIAAIISGLLEQSYGIEPQPSYSEPAVSEEDFAARIARRGVWRVLHCDPPQTPRVPGTRGAAAAEIVEPV